MNLPTVMGRNWKSPFEMVMEESLLSFDQLIENIKNLAPNEHVYWFNDAYKEIPENVELKYPDNKIIKKIKSVCEKHQVNLVLPKSILKQ